MQLALFLHVLGAMLLVGSLIAVGFATVLGRGSPDRAPGPESDFKMRLQRELEIMREREWRLSAD